MTTKGQVTIPKYIRDKMGFLPGDQILFDDIGDSVTLVSAPDFFSFRGALKGRKPFNIKNMKTDVAEKISQRYTKTLNGG